ncbi:MAG: hypothetical protein ABW189_05370 [Rickettsiales bacterium]
MTVVTLGGGTALLVARALVVGACEKLLFCHGAELDGNTKEELVADTTEELFPHKTELVVGKADELFVDAGQLEVGRADELFVDADQLEVGRAEELFVDADRVVAGKDEVRDFV